MQASSYASCSTIAQAVRGVLELVSSREISHKARMSSVVNVAIHRSQFPDAVRRDLLDSLRRRQVNHKFHYDSVKQTHKWLALHAKYSPSRNDTDCQATYDRSFASAVARAAKSRIHVVGLGCGSGQKDARLLKLLREAGREVCYTPCDVSTAMVLVAREAALAAVPGVESHPLVCDLATAEDLAGVMDSRSAPHGSRLITFFGMIPNFEPGEILPKLANLVRAQDCLLFGANLAPGADYAAGLRFILPQYNNPLTRAWLLTFLLDLGVDRGDGEVRFTAERGTGSLRRVVARFHFRKSRRVVVEGCKVSFLAGENVRLFFSYRYTPELVREQLAQHELVAEDQWVTRSGEEGIFLVRRA